MIEKLIGIAKNEVGYLEKKSNSQLDNKTANAGRNNYTKYARDLDNIPGFYNGKKNGYAWCDVFVDWCFVQVFGVDKAKELLCQPDKSLGAGVYYSANYYKKKKQFYKTPKKGDQIFFINSKGNETHTGLVVNVDSKKVYTIEGNTSSARGVVSNGGCVREKSYSLNYKYISGYGRPKYDEPAKTKYTGTFPTLILGKALKRGSKGTQVKYLQKLLNWINGSKLVIDGSFGPATETQVKKYQTNYGLEVDGKFGPKSLAKSKTIEK